MKILEFDIFGVLSKVKRPKKACLKRILNLEGLGTEICTFKKFARIASGAAKILRNGSPKLQNGQKFVSKLGLRKA